ncbi:MAG: response regulator transcription factor [Coriobacteriales bacterium]|jgi:two-component system response regulator NreC|nr:response regulator transcription factor [Coriobacteriales bacterium]
MLRIALVDEHELVRIGLKTVLKLYDDFQVVADVADHSRICVIAQEQQPDLVLIDAAASGALDSLEQLRQCYHDIKIALMSTSFSLDCLLHTLCGNSDGYFLKSVSPSELIAAVNCIAANGVYIHSTLMENLPQHLLKAPQQMAADKKMSKMASKRIMAQQQLSEQLSGQLSGQLSEQLSEREQDIVNLLAKGYTNREVSEHMYLSAKTVEAYRARIYNKLGVNTRSALVAFAVEHGLVAF